jgi:hypothetical protein
VKDAAEYLIRLSDIFRVHYFPLKSRHAITILGTTKLDNTANSHSQGIKVLKLA